MYKDHRKRSEAQRDLVTGNRAKLIAVQCSDCHLLFKRMRQDTWQHNCDACRKRERTVNPSRHRAHEHTIVSAAEYAELEYLTKIKLEDRV